MPVLSTKTFTWRDPEDSARLKNKQEEENLRIRIRRIHRQQIDAMHRNAEESRELQLLLVKDVQSSTGYSRVEKNYGVVKVVHEYQFRKTDTDETQPTRTPTGLTRVKIRKKVLSQNSTYPPLSLSNSAAQLEELKKSSTVFIRGEKAELQERQKNDSKTSLKERNLSHAGDFEKNMQKESTSSASLASLKRKNKPPLSEGRAASPFNTLLLPPAFKLSTSRIVGRRALSAPPFDRSATVDGSKGDISSHKLKHEGQQQQSSKHRAKSAIPIASYMRAVENGLSTEYIVQSVFKLKVPLSTRAIRREVERIRGEHEEKKWKDIVELHEGKEKVKRIRLRITNFLKQ